MKLFLESGKSWREAKTHVFYGAVAWVLLFSLVWWLGRTYEQRIMTLIGKTGLVSLLVTLGIVVFLYLGVQWITSLFEDYDEVNPDDFRKTLRNLWEILVMLFAAAVLVSFIVAGAFLILAVAVYDSKVRKTVRGFFASIWSQTKEV